LDLDLIQVSLLAILQGLTEFLPISSSGHLLLPSLLLGWADQGLSFDVAVHVGSLLAVIGYFRSDIRRLLLAWLLSLHSGKSSADSKLAWLLLIATLPAGITGLLFSDVIELYARSVIIAAVASIIFALLLLWSDRVGKYRKELFDLNWKQALFIGIAQTLALIPGTSRSGVTMTAALFCNLNRQAAARFSFLLAIPIIVASGLLKFIEVLNSDAGVGVAGHWQTLMYAAGISALVAFSCIHFFLRLIESIGFLPFVIYRIVLGCVLLAVYFV
jgi:undecaprenyl-diphosphatase|tara:strand:- start:871 stop:1689 length:819 start_codon:yes stop_codon:yes gene_type:complete